MIRVVVADDQALVRGGFRLILETQPDIEVCGEAGDGSSAVQRVVELQPNVVLMDVRMPGMDGVAATRQLLARPDVSTRVLILTTFDLDAYVYEALRAGASGFLLKDVDPPDLVHAIRMVARGESMLAPALTRRLIEQYTHRPPPPSAGTPPELAELTARELEVLREVARGRTNTEIAASLFLSQATVKTHVAHVLGKLGLRDRVQAVVRAYETGLVEPGRE